ncbi:DNA polymerase epsilon subunit B (macronuclear) [Tetrahymena thermophila SB210]|uniref:DNA polymerase alpha subunit B n=1 Tax=Tetrahymena thermophila (strain SB210) TaxID=312017 RepID=I7MAE1_TETTS|nr:DNA polymerase epsilon subunit B [Tetrahymena thermophila SB210]EAS04406.1 DNA polymerase epsilon subunit B [Tetrahymena thermophila SB210]7UY8_B Chain B, DNA polymerase alpha subunit B [Tetrahymena thermophila]|eukprot:XP_001024651.1 DNA polymerase epsilon subunit B [Tetrahymena thermophila SB210]
MEEFEKILEEIDSANLSQNAVQQLKQLIISNGILDDEQLMEKWLFQLEAIIYNSKQKFLEAQLMDFKKNVLNQDIKKPQNDNFKKIKESEVQKNIDIIKGDADLFTKASSAKKQTSTQQANNAAIDCEEQLRQQLGKESMLDPKRFSYNSNLPQVNFEKNQHQNSNNMTIVDLFEQYDPNKIPNYLTNNIDKIRKHLEQRILTFKIQNYSQFIVNGEQLINDVSSYSKTEEVKMVGRLISTENGFLNTTNLRIELNRNQYFDLVFENDFDFGNNVLFPNQIVMVKGIINEKEELVVSELITDHIKEITDEEHPKIDNLNQDESQLIMVAAGPFSTVMSTQYTSFDNILHVAKTKKVSTLILLGPFLDIKNEILKDGSIIINSKEYTFEQLQNSLFEKAVKELEGKTQIIIVPSTRDILSTDSIPQMSLEIKVSEHKNSIHSYSNPAYIDIDKLRVYIANSDVGMITLQNSLLDKKIPYMQQSRLTFKALMNQQNLYSIYPMRNPQDSQQILETVKLPNINDFDIPFDYQLEQYPHIIISPSSLPKFATKIYNTVVINPNYVIRDGSQAGNFAIITLFKDSDIPIHERTRVDLYCL